MTSSRNPAPSRRYLRHGMLPQLAAFEAVMRLGSASRAADALCIAPSTLSGHLRKLGDALGVRLFEIEGKRLVPTEAAHVLLQTTQEVFARLAQCEQALADMAQSAPSQRQRGRADSSDDADAEPAGHARHAAFAGLVAGQIWPS